MCVCVYSPYDEILSPKFAENSQLNKKEIPDAENFFPKCHSDEIDAAVAGSSCIKTSKTASCRSTWFEKQLLDVSCPGFVHHHVRTKAGRQFYIILIATFCRSTRLDSHAYGLEWRAESPPLGCLLACLPLLFIIRLPSIHAKMISTILASHAPISIITYIMSRWTSGSRLFKLIWQRRAKASFVNAAYELDTFEWEEIRAISHALRKDGNK